MFSFGGSEFLIIAVLVLLLFGPDKIPQLARTIGRYTREFRKYRDIMEATLRAEMGEAAPQTEWQSDYEHRLAEERAKKERDEIEGISETPAPEAVDDEQEAAASTAASEEREVAEPCDESAPVLSAAEVVATSEDDEEEEA